MSHSEQVAAPRSPAHAPDDPRRLGVLRHRHFRNVWIGAAISSVGSWMESVGVQWVVAQDSQKPEWVAHHYPSATLMMGYLAAAQLTPTLVLGLLGGLIADYVNRKRLLLVTQAILMVIAACVAAASYFGLATPWVLMILMGALGTTMAFNVPAWQVLTPRLVPREELTKAITLNGIQFNLARVVGPALAGAILVLNHDRATPLFVINAVSFMAVLIAVWGTPDAPAPSQDGRRPTQDVREAIRFVFRNKGPLAIFTGMVLFSILAAPLLRMLPLFVSEVYHAKSNVFGMMLALMGLGAVGGGLAMKLVPTWYPKHHLIPLSISLGGISILLFSATSNVYLAGLWMVFCGAFWLWSFNSSMAAMQLLVSDAMRGRVLAVCNTAVFGAMPIGSVLAAYIAEAAAGRDPTGNPTALGVQIGVGSLAAVLTLAGLVMLTWRTPEVDGLVPGQPGYARRRSLLAGITASAHRPTVEPNMSDTPGV